MPKRKLRNTVGLILPTITNFYSQAVIDHLQQQLSAYNYHLIVMFTYHDVEKEKEYLKLLTPVTDGIFLISDALDYEQIKPFIPRSIPTIFLNRKPKGCTLTCIIENDYSAVYQSIFSMLHSGHDKIACICSRSYLSTTQEIVHAYKTAMSTSAINEDVEPYICYADSYDYDIASIMETCLSKSCTGFFAGSQTLTEQLLDYLTLYRSTHPDTPLALSGFANQNPKAALQRSIDTVAQPIGQITDLAVQQILYMIQHPNASCRDYILKGLFHTRSLDSF